MKHLTTLLLLALLVLGGCTSTLKDVFDTSPQGAKAMIVGLDDFRLCEWSFNRFGALRSKEFQYRFKKPTVEEIKRRNLDCKSFPEFKDKKDWIEDWVKNYEESLNL